MQQKNAHQPRGGTNLFELVSKAVGDVYIGSRDVLKLRVLLQQSVERSLTRKRFSSHLPRLALVYRRPLLLSIIISSKLF